MGIKKFLNDWNNFWAFFVGLIPAILLYIFPPSQSIPFGIFIILILLLLIALWLAIRFYLDLKKQEVTLTIPIIECVHNICICKTNDFISYSSIVSFYQKIGSYERTIGYGLVETIVEGKTAQIKVFSTCEDIVNLIEHINNNKDCIIIRPTITLDRIKHINSLINQEV